MRFRDWSWKDEIEFTHRRMHFRDWSWKDEILIERISNYTQETCWCYCGNQKAFKEADDVLQKNIVAKETDEIKMILKRQKEV